MREKKINQKEIAKKLGISRSSLYYKPRREEIDQEVRFQIEKVLIDNPNYGHRRIALALKLNRKRILRVMKKYSIKPLRKRSKIPKKKKDKGRSRYHNLIKNICPIRPNIIWVSDFTYIKYQGKFIYLAVIMDLFTRRVLGFNILRFHNQNLVLGALKQSLRNNYSPIYHHSDQGSEYDSARYVQLLNEKGIKISMSKKGSPWENGSQESFFGRFKEEFGEINRFKDVSVLIEQIYQKIYYYNNQRIHTSLKCTPMEFLNKYEKTIEYVSKKMGT